MPRLLVAVREWGELRARVREEREFHLNRAAADLRALGLTARDAKRMAHIRFGSRRHMQTGRKEIGADFHGLIDLLRANRVAASLWLQPVVLLLAVAMIFGVSPSPREIAEGTLGHKFGSEDHGKVAFSVYGSGPTTPGITETELEALQSMSTVTDAKILGPHYVVAQRAQGATLAAIASEAIIRTGNRAFYAEWLPPQPKVMTSPAKVIWLFIAIYGAFFLSTSRPERVALRWLSHAISTACLQALTSILAWALAIQFWNRVTWPSPAIAGLTFSALVVLYLLTAAAQCCYWWNDLRHRCPICLDRLLLSLTEGNTSRILLCAAITESICAHGHGVLTESRWSGDFHNEQSSLNSLARI